MNSKPENVNKSPKRRKQAPGQAFLGVGMSMATELAVAVGIGFFAGQWLDKKFGVTPWATVVMIFLFLGAYMFHLVIILKHLQGDTDRESSQENDEKKKSQKGGNDNNGFPPSSYPPGGAQS